jgi:hypothetical protein
MKKILLVVLAILAICLVSIGCAGKQGEQGIQGEQGDPGVQGAQMATCYGETGIPMDWNGGEAAFVIDPDNLPRLLGSGFSPNKTVKIYLVVAPTSSVLVATVTTNSIGCFCADLTELNQAGDTIPVEPDASLDRTRSDGDGFRECYFQAEVDGQQVTMWPMVLSGTKYSKVQSANAELVTVQAAIESCLAEANSASLTSAVAAWSGADGAVTVSPGVDHPAGGVVEYTVYAQMRTHQLRAAYDISVSGDITNGDPTITGGWGSEIQWNATLHKWQETP